MRVQLGVGLASQSQNLAAVQTLTYDHRDTFNKGGPSPLRKFFRIGLFYTRIKRGLIWSTEIYEFRLVKNKPALVHVNFL